MSTLAKVTEVVAEVLEVDPNDVTPGINLIDELGMDSVLAIDVATALEKHYKVKVPDEKMEALTTPAAIATIIDALIAAAR